MALTEKDLTKHQLQMYENWFKNFYVLTRTIVLSPQRNTIVKTFGLMLKDAEAEKIKFADEGYDCKINKCTMDDYLEYCGNNIDGAYFTKG